LAYFAPHLILLLDLNLSEADNKTTFSATVFISIVKDSPLKCQTKAHRQKRGHKTMKRVFKYVSYLLLTLLLAAGLFFIHVWYFKPFNINLFFGKTALQFVMDSPETLSSLRVLEPLGIDGHNAKLDDASMEAGDKMMAQIQETYNTLLSYDDADLDPADKMSKDVMASLLEVVVESQRFRFHNYPVNQLFGVQSNFPAFMESTHQINNLGDAEDYISRLQAVDTKFNQILDGLKHREQLGILPPQFVVTKVLAEMR